MAEMRPATFRTGILLVIFVHVISMFYFYCYKSKVAKGNMHKKLSSRIPLSSPSHHHRRVKVSTPKQSKKRAYVLLSYGEREKQCATIAAALACRDVAKNEDVVIIRIGRPIDEHLLPNGIRQHLANFPVTKEGNGGGARFAKFYVVDFNQYDSVVFVDYDVFVRKPLDALFDLAEQLPDTMITPRAYWLKQPYMMSGTFALSRGTINQTIHKALSEVTHDGNNEWARKMWQGDMHWLNSANIRDDVTLVSGFYTLLVGEFYPKDFIYNYWGKRYGWTPSHVLKEALLVHFIAGWKPWMNGIREAKGNTTPELELVFSEWRHLRSRVCT